MDHDQNSTTPAGGQGGIDHKSEWLEAIRYVSLPDHRSAIMKKESSGWELASSRFLTPGDLVTGYVNAPITPLFHQAERIFQKVELLLRDRTPSPDLSYGKLQPYYSRLIDVLWEMEAVCGNSGLFAGIINRTSYLELHAERLDLPYERVVEISRGIQRDLAALQEWHAYSREILVELSSTGYAESGHATGAYMLSRLWQLCAETFPQFSQSYTGGFLQIPLRGKTPDLQSDLALLIKGIAQMGNKRAASGSRQNALSLLDRRAEPDYPRIIAEYKVVTSPELALIWDFVDCLKCSCTPAICPVCKKAFVRTRGRRVYCSAECGLPENRTELYQKRKTDDAQGDNAVLLEAEQYLRTMRARLNYISKDDRKPRKRVLTQEDFNDWFARYKKQRSIYMNIKGTETDPAVIEKAGNTFLEAIRPEDYKPHRRKNSHPLP